MKICIDIQSAITQRAGVGRYTRMLVECLAGIATQGNLSCFYFDFMRRGVNTDIPKVAKRAIRWIPGSVAQQFWKHLRFPPFNWLAGKADLYHFPNFVIPPLSRGLSVVTIHDVSFLRYPEFTEARNLSYLKRRLNETVKRAHLIITDSEFCLREIENLLPDGRGKTVAIHLGIGPEFTPAVKTELRAWRKKRKLERPYLLSVGTLEPRKNFMLLLDVFEKLEEFEGDLVIAGRQGWKCEPLLQRLKTSKRAPHIRWLSDIADDELPLLYAGAECLLFPSVYEGFGFPPLEAMACETPVIVSSGGSLPEVVGGGGLVLPDWEVETWLEATRNLLAGEALKKKLIEDGKKWVLRYTWEATARQTWDAYHSLQSRV